MVSFFDLELFTQSILVFSYKVGSSLLNILVSFLVHLEFLISEDQNLLLT